MAELEPQQPELDPIASLHKMSTTAGVATGDYVAINNMAITAAVLGLSTSMAFMGLPFLLLGAVAIGMGVVAIRQIGHSNGTQGGKGLAILGIALSLLLGGGAVFQKIQAESALRPEKQKISAAISEFGRRISAGDYTGAYALCDVEFQTSVPLAYFERQFRILQDPIQSGSGGVLQQLKCNEVFEFRTANGRRAVHTMAVIRMAGVDAEDRLAVVLSQLPSGDWRINYIAQMFDQRGPKKGQ